MGRFWKHWAYIENYTLIILTNKVHACKLNHHYNILYTFCKRLNSETFPVVSSPLTEQAHDPRLYDVIAHLYICFFDKYLWTHYFLCALPVEIKLKSNIDAGICYLQLDASEQQCVDIQNLSRFLANVHWTSYTCNHSPNKSRLSNKMPTLPD